jgi:hypothetical protein
LTSAKSENLAGIRKKLKQNESLGLDSISDMIEECPKNFRERILKNGLKIRGTLGNWLHRCLFIHLEDKDEIFKKFQKCLEPTTKELDATITIDEILTKQYYKDDSLRQQIADKIGIKLPSLTSNVLNYIR